MYNKDILVSIVCEVYNHEAFLRDCLDGFVTQVTNFGFVILIHDDASTDSSPIIIKEYVKKYPHLFKPIFQKENQYSRGINVWTTYQFPRVQTKYIALCEGDDYWTDKYKLQKQIDFMENHKAYSMCFHNAIEHFEDNPQNDHQFSNVENRDYTGLEIYENWLVHTASVVIRKDVTECRLFNKLFHERSFKFGDILLFLSASSCGKIYGMTDIMSVYRRHSSSITARVNFGRESTQIKLAKDFIELAKIMGKDYKPYAEKNYTQNYLTLFMLSKEKGATNWKYLWNALFRYPMNFLRFSPHKHKHYITKIMNLLKP